MIQVLVDRGEGNDREPFVTITSPSCHRERYRSEELKLQTTEEVKTLLKLVGPVVRVYCSSTHTILAFIVLTPPFVDGDDLFLVFTGVHIDRSRG